MNIVLLPIFVPLKCSTATQCHWWYLPWASGKTPGQRRWWQRKAMLTNRRSMKTHDLADPDNFSENAVIAHLFKVCLLQVRYMLDEGRDSIGPFYYLWLWNSGIVSQEEGQHAEECWTPGVPTRSKDAQLQQMWNVLRLQDFYTSCLGGTRPTCGRRKGGLWDLTQWAKPGRLSPVTTPPLSTIVHQIQPEFCPQIFLTSEVCLKWPWCPRFALPKRSRFHS